MRKLTSITINYYSLHLFFVVLLFFAHHVQGDHPSIFFSADDIADIRSKATSSHSAIMKPILSQAASLLSSAVPPEPTGAAYSTLSLASRDIMVLAFAFVATGDARYCTRGKEYLLSFASWNHWGADRELGDRDLSLGFMLKACALAYDWLYDSLSGAEQTTVRTALVKHSQAMYEAAAGEYNADWLNWWSQSYGQNHWDHNNACLGLAALVLDGECDSSSTWLDHAISEMRKDSFNLAGIGDGTWHEGCLYQNSKLTTTMPFYYNLKRLKGIDLFPENYLRAYARFALYNYLPSERQMVLTFSSYIRDWGGWLSAAGYSLLSLVASECNSGLAQWLWEKMGTELGRSSYQAGNHIPEFFYYSPSITPVPPTDLPLSARFTDLEGVIWRTGWGTDDLTFGLKCGSYGGTFLYHHYLSKMYPFDVDGANLNVGHNHADANTFWLYRGRVTLIGEKEGRSLYNDLNYANQSSSHNTLLIDGKGQYFPTDQTGVYQDNDGTIRFSCSVRGYDFVEADASNRYRATATDKSIGPPMISQFVRNVLFVRPSYFIFVDNVADSLDHDYSLRFHFGDSAGIDTSAGWIHAICTQNNSVGIRILAPDQYRFSTADSIRPAVSISPSTQVKRMDFVSVVYPSLETEWDEKPEFSPAITTRSATLVHVPGDIAFDHMIRHAVAYDTSAIGEYELSGKVASIGKTADGTIRDLFLGNGTSIADKMGERILVQSSANVNGLHIDFGDTAVTVYLDQSGETDLRFFAPGISPELVKVPGWNVTASSTGDYLTIAGTAPVKQRKRNTGNVNNTLFTFHNHETMYFQAPETGRLTLHAFRLDGKCIWQSGERHVVKGMSITIPCEKMRIPHSVVVVTAEINGDKSAQLLLKTFQ